MRTTVGRRPRMDTVENHAIVGVVLTKTKKDEGRVRV